ncbi:glycosyltransferase [Pseudonocardia sp. TMWB2A]|uniref:polysaccharide deacetylase family protein n=1 Tax=Pseudonocardia sp. TMWB2A TaxID=687430 RepID=UPI00307F6F28
MRTPQLAIVVDAEEEFDWTQPFSRANQATSSMTQQCAAHAIYDDLGVIPTYVIDYPIAVDPDSVAYLGAMQREGRAEIGTQLHPWVNPPHDEDVTRDNSYLCNLPPALQRAKIETLHRAITQSFGTAPTIFKAGRYGFGPVVAEVIADLGYKIDCSHVPHTSFAADGGPDYCGTPDQPFWLDEAQTLLEIPLTVGFSGAASGLGPAFATMFDNVRAKQLHLVGALARSGLVSRARLTPEGVSAQEQCRLLRALHDQGQRIFTLTYHSPSLVAGHTPYVRDDAELKAFNDTIRTVLTWFRDELGGGFTTLSAIYDDMAAARDAAKNSARVAAE